MEIDKRAYYRSIVSEIKDKNSLSDETWKCAEKLYKILKNEEYKEIYSTLAAFGKDIGLSNSSLVQYKNAVEFANREKIDKTAISVGGAYLLSTLGYEYKDFLEDLHKEGIKLSDLTVYALRKRISEWKNGYKHNEGTVTFTLNKERYCIPREVLRQYKVNSK